VRLATISHQGVEQAAVVVGERVVPVRRINAELDRSWPDTVWELINAGLDRRLGLDAKATRGGLKRSEALFAPPYRHPRKIWGIGLNYQDHARDLGAPFPDEPASFLKGDHTIVGPGDRIILPPQSERVTAEGELALVIGRACRNVPREQALDYLAGVTLAIDMTAEDILQRNPRFLTRAKNFDTFFSFGPELVTLDEAGDLATLRVGTYLNGQLHRENLVANMAFSPAFLVSFHSHVATLHAGDIISTGTPGAVVIEDGDTAECRIDRLGALANPVARLPG
jgi:2-keto-4-pentenoate hydratase/2-oxohepta-3-ene-1,7-dioic acid hydratase in catechol pathway